MGSEKQIRATLEELAQSLVLADIANLASLAEIHTHFQNLEKDTQGILREAAKATAAVVERLILAEEPPAALEVVGQVVSLFQSALFSERELCLSDFPAALKLGGAPSPTLPANVDESIFAAFLAAQPSVLEEMEELVLTLEKTPSEELLAHYKRLVHTLKGEAGLMGLGDVESLCHHIEDAMESRPFADLVDPLLVAKDWLSRRIQQIMGQGSDPGPFDSSSLLAQPSAKTTAPGPKKTRAKKSAAPKKTRGKAKPAATVATVSSEDILDTDFASPEIGNTLPGPSDLSLLKDFLTEASEHLESADVHLLTIETSPRDQEALNAVFRSFHTIKGVAGFLELADISSLAHEAENLLDLARNHALLLAGPAIDVTFEAVDALKHCLERWSKYLRDQIEPVMDASINQLIERIKLAARGQRKGDEANAPPKLGEILTVTGKTTPEALSKVLDAQKKEPDASSVKLGEMLVKTATVSAKEIAHALRTQTAAEAQQHAIAVHEVVRVDAQRLDRIVDNIGELVIAVSMVRQSVLLGGDGADLGRQLGHLDKITRELQEMGTSLRMVPVRPVFQKMARLARDVAKKIGKQVEFVTFGDDTELDKAVVDRISDPLVHMVRNAIDHGLESDPVDRHKLGKAEVGRVELRAFHKAGNIHIEISDDGRGLDREAIRRKAIERGIIADSEILTDREIFALIFQPGFSTAKQVTDVSGRGVGMDVVKRNIEALRGRVEVQSEMGRGSCFSISLPLTLAIIDGMVIRVGQERYIVPTLSIVTSLRPEPASICTVLKRGEMLSFQDELIPLVRVHEIFDIPHGDRDDRNIIVVIIENEGRKTGLVIDELIGQQQIVIKSLGESLRGMPGITGGAIMPDGRVGLILDVGGLVKLSHAARPSLHEEQPGFEEELALAGAGA